VAQESLYVHRWVCGGVAQEAVKRSLARARPVNYLWSVGSDQELRVLVENWTVGNTTTG